MRNFTAFLPHKTPVLVKEGKKITALAYEVNELEIKLNALTNALNDLEENCINQALQYNTHQEIQEAKLKAICWNTTPANLRTSNNL